MNDEDEDDDECNKYRYYPIFGVVSLEPNRVKPRDVALMV